MITGKLQKQGENYIVTLPQEEVERLGLADGQEVVLEVQALDDEPSLVADLRHAFDTEFHRGKEGLRYLADH